MYKVEENEKGKQLIERLEGQNATLVYSYGFECGTSNFNSLDFGKDVVKMKSAIVQLDTNNEPIGKPMSAREWCVDLPLADCIDEAGNINVVVLKDLYIDSILQRQTPPVVEEVVEEVEAV
jgi:hypothetical protein